MREMSVPRLSASACELDGVRGLNRTADQCSLPWLVCTSMVYDYKPSPLPPRCSPDEEVLQILSENLSRAGPLPRFSHALHL